MSKRQPAPPTVPIAESSSTSLHTTTSTNPIIPNPKSSESTSTSTSGTVRKRRSSTTAATQQQQQPSSMSGVGSSPGNMGGGGMGAEMGTGNEGEMGPPAKKSRTNTPWTPAEEQRLKTMRDAGSSWAEIAKTFPSRTEGSVKKHWYKDMHYAEFAEDESQALLNAIKEYDMNKWKEIGKKVGKPAKACEQYAKEHFQGKI